MTLVAAEGLLSKIAKAAEDDPRGTAELVRYALAESLADQIEELRPQLERDVAKAMADELVDTRRALVRGYVAKRAAGEDVSPYRAAAVHLTALDRFVTKAWTGFGSKPGERDQSGRFKARFGGDPETDRSRNGRHREYAAWLDQAKRSGAVKDDAAVHIRGRIKETGPNPSSDWTSDDFVLTRRLNGDGDKHPQSLPEGFVPLQASIDPKGVKGGAKGVAALDLMSGFTSPETAGRLAGVFGDTGRVNRGLGQLADARELDDPSARRYQTLRTTGRALAAVSTPGSPGHVVGGLAQLVGEIGPEAERVLEPGVRRTAYRYRGTEQRPNRELVQDVKRVNETTTRGLLTGTDEQRQQRMLLNQGGGGRGQGQGGSTAGDAVFGTEAHYSRARARGPVTGGRSQTEPQRGLARGDVQGLTMQMRGDVAASHLLSRVPDMRQAELSMAAGRVPPSQGVIIDADGDVVADSVGFNGDHYLPFDLRNLSDLSGGQYTRTRVAGGLTGEDIYTGLMSNARQVQVVSNSGVFTLELDPDLRGGRRYSDKARQMVGRYQQILSTIDRGNAPMLQDISNEERRRIRTQALEEVGAGDQDAFHRRVGQLEEESRFRAMMSGPSDEDIEADAREAATNEMATRQRNGDRVGRGDFDAAVREHRNKALAQSREERVRRLQLDGEGYASAMQALQGEFPQYIARVQFETLPEFMASRSLRPTGGRDTPKRSVGPDRGYVRPGRNSPYDTDRRGPVSRETEAAGGAPAAAPGAATPQRPGAPAAATANADTGIKTVARVAPLALAVPSQVSWSDAQREGASRIKRQLGQRLAGVLQHAVRLPVGTKASGGTTDDEALDLDEYGYSVWLNTTKGENGDPDKLAAFLLDPKNARHLDKVRDSLTRYEDNIAQAEDHERPHLEQVLSSDKISAALEAIDQASSVGGSPFAEPAENPALARPASKNPRPQPYADIVALGADTEAYDRYLAAAQRDTQQQGFHQAVQALSAIGDPAERARSVAESVDETEAVQLWGRRLQDDPQARRPGDVDEGITAPQAVELVRSPTTSSLYRHMDNLQSAWAFVHGRAVAQGLTGGGASPKAPDEVGKRGRRVFLYPPTSPLAQALAKRLR